MKTIAIIPCYNVQETCRDVIQRTRPFVTSVIAIDDGSLDRTFEELKKTDADILRFEKNRGKGAALREGFVKAKSMGPFDCIVLLDSDDQHNPAEIPKLTQHLQNTGSDLVIGIRSLRLSHMPFIRVIANRFSTWIISILSKQNLHDAQSGFRALSPRLLTTFSLTKDRFEMETEMIIKAARHGLTISEVPIETHYASGHGQLKGWPVRDVYRTIKIWVESLFWRNS